jgi:hypothetical protein
VPDHPWQSRRGTGASAGEGAVRWKRWSCKDGGTQARKGRNVTTVLFNNSSQSTLEVELGRVDPEAAGERSRSTLDLARPASTS